MIAVLIVVLVQLLLAAAYTSGDDNVTCIMNPISPAILRNSTMTYQAKADLFHANSDRYDEWSTTVTRLTLHNTSFVELPSFPPLCPQIAPYPTFTPGTSWFSFGYEYSAVRNIVNASSAGVRCGLDCSTSGYGNVVTGEPYAYRDVMGVAYANVTTRLKNGTNITVEVANAILSNTTADIQCTVYEVPNTIQYDSVCTAYIQYNATYWENSSVYAMPSLTHSPAILDPSTTTLSVGVSSPMIIWLPSELTVCPWYYNVSALSMPAPPSPSSEGSNIARPYPTVMIEMIYTKNDDSSDVQYARSLLLLTIPDAQCDVAASHPIHGGSGVRIKGSISSDQLITRGNAFLQQRSVVYNLSITSLRLEYFLPLVAVTDVKGLTANATRGSSSSLFGSYPQASLSFQARMVPRLSPWWPMENYSNAELSNVPRRCYASAPRSINNSSATLYLPTILCASGAVAPLLIDVLNDTAFCCYMNISSALLPIFMWPGYIYVYDTGTQWFVDTAGIVATPSPAWQTLIPSQSSGEAGSSSNSSVSGGGGSNGLPDEGLSSNSGADSVTPSSNAAIILGVTFVGIGGAIVFMAVLYFKWWKPRQGSGGHLVSAHRHKAAALSSPLLMLDGGVDDVLSPARLGQASVAAKLKDSSGVESIESFFDEVEPTEMEEL
jgi:hypothetical protein